MGRCVNKLKFVFAVWVSFFLTIAVFGQNLAPVNNLIDKYKSSTLLKNSQWCLYAEYLENGKTLINHNSDMSVAPASGLKVFTSITALEILGEDFRFQTKIYYDGKLNGNILDGNVFIVGGGDPTLGSDLVKGSLPLMELISKIISDIQLLGIQKITGSVIADCSAYEYQPIPDNWNYIDIGNYYGASSSALSINENLYRLFFRPGKKVGDIAEVIRTEPEIPNLTFTNLMRTGESGSGDNGYIYNAPLQYNAYLQGTVPKGANEFVIKGSIPDPPLFTAELLLTELNKKGIIIAGGSQKTYVKQNYNKLKLVTTIFSPPLKDIVYILNKRSNNLYAELLLKAIAYKSNGIGSTSEGIKIVEQFLSKEKINTNGFNISDGSGLSRSNMISARMMTKLLSAVSRKNYFNAFYNSLGIVGDSNDIGFYKNLGIGTALEKNAHIKSGVIQGVRSYSGFIKDRNGKTIIFSMIANNFDGSGARVSEIHREIMNELANLK